MVNNAVKSLKNSGVAILDHLFPTHEEADTRIVLHAIDLAKSHNRIVVHCDDTCICAFGLVLQ